MDLEQYKQMIGLWQSYKISSAAQLDKYLGNFRVLFAFHSGKIENEEITFHDTREIFENGRIINFSGNPRTLFEQQNQKLCYEVLKEKIMKKEPLTMELIKEIHRALTEGTYDERRYIENEERPGEFKKHQRHKTETQRFRRFYSTHVEITIMNKSHLERDGFCSNT